MFICDLLFITKDYVNIFVFSDMRNSKRVTSDRYIESSITFVLPKRKISFHPIACDPLFLNKSDGSAMNSEFWVEIQ